VCVACKINLFKLIFKFGGQKRAILSHEKRSVQDDNNDEGKELINKRSQSDQIKVINCFITAFLSLARMRKKFVDAYELIKKVGGGRGTSKHSDLIDNFLSIDDNVMHLCTCYAIRA
jgi:hypothetical protein